jgi:hypothetical protein
VVRLTAKRGWRGEAGSSGGTRRAPRGCRPEATGSLARRSLQARPSPRLSPEEPPERVGRAADDAQVAAVDAAEVMEGASGGLALGLVAAAVRAEHDVMGVGAAVAAPRDLAMTAVAVANLPRAAAGARNPHQVAEKCAAMIARHFPAGRAAPTRSRTASKAAASTTAIRCGSATTILPRARICRSRSPSTARERAMHVSACARGVQLATSASGSFARRRSFSYGSLCRRASRSAGDSQSRLSSAARCSTARAEIPSRSSQ